MMRRRLLQWLTAEPAWWESVLAGLAGLIVALALLYWFIAPNL